MEHLKIKVIGVLREREELCKGSANKIKTNVAAAICSDGGGVGDGGGGGGGCIARPIVVRQLPKVSQLDLAGILNCRRRLEWTKEWLKKNQSEFFCKENLLKEIQSRGNETYHLNCFFDITEWQFRFLVTKLAPIICSYEPHRKKKSFSAEERIAITLKYLATGEVHSCRNYCFRASKPVILNMISNICLKMYELLKDQYLSLPKTDEQWQNVANEMQRRHRLPNCLGILAMQQMQFHTTAAASRTEDETNNPNKLPLIFTAIVDSNNNFMYADIEKTKTNVHEEIYEYSTAKELIESNELTLPSVIDARQGLDISYYFAGSSALPVRQYLLNSYYPMPIDGIDVNCNFYNKISEYKYCSAMDIANKHADNAIRMLSNIFPILSHPLRLDEENARKITLGCVALYNFLRKTDAAFFRQTERMHLKVNGCSQASAVISVDDDDNMDEDDDCILIATDEELREREEFTPNVALTSCFQSLRKQKGNTAAGLAKRNTLMQYFANKI